MQGSLQPASNSSPQFLLLRVIITLQADHDTRDTIIHLCDDWEHEAGNCSNFIILDILSWLHWSLVTMLQFSAMIRMSSCSDLHKHMIISVRLCSTNYPQLKQIRRLMLLRTTNLMIICTIVLSINYHWHALLCDLIYRRGGITSADTNTWSSQQQCCCFLLSCVLSVPREKHHFIIRVQYKAGNWVLEWGGHIIKIFYIQQLDSPVSSLTTALPQ